MSTVQEIKSAMAKLSLEERAEILADLCDWKDDDWDREMKADAASGNLTRSIVTHPKVTRFRSKRF